MRRMHSQLFLRLLSIPVMLVLILVLHVLRIPSPTLLLMLPVIYCTYKDGYLGGALSSTPVFAYALFLSFHPTSASPNMANVVTVLFSLAAVIAWIGHLQTTTRARFDTLQQLNESLFHLASTDKLTGAANRHSFFDLADAAYQHSLQQQSPLAVLFIDADHFKTINDTWGHPFGDQVLLQLFEVINACLRSSDLCCRYGGEEFLVLLLQSDCNTACSVAERMMEKARALHFPECPSFQLTVSIGIAAGIPSHKQRLEDFINNADCAMYQAKKSGRNRAVLRMLLDGISAAQ